MKHYFEAMKQKKILVVGDVMLDHFYYGVVNRFSPESPNTPVLDVQRHVTMPGGAGNVTMNLKSLGIQVSLASVMGDDLAGKDLINLMGCDQDELIVRKNRATTVKTRFINARQQLLRVDEETRDDIDSGTEKELWDNIKTRMIDCDGVIVSDYNKGVLTVSLLKNIMALAQEYEIPVLVDPKKQDYSLYKGASLITPNLKELAEITGCSVDTEHDISRAAAQLMMQYGFTQVVVTRSEKGMSVFVQGKDPIHLSASSDTAVDVSGAGDTVIASLAASLVAGACLAEAAEIANNAGGLVVQKTGTALVDLQDLTKSLEGQKNSVVIRSASHQEAPLCSWNDAAAYVSAWKKQGLIVGFTNGCFDILHAGHVRYLNRARDRCDILVLGLNHDQSIHILKGEDRPFHDEESRATVIGALGAIDLVVLFGAEMTGQDNTPCALIQMIKPDIYFKGGDYTIDQLPEAKIMEAIGGKVEIMSLYEGHSTTSTLNKMKDTEAA